jgi:hypothetical protein
LNGASSLQRLVRLSRFREIALGLTAADSRYHALASPDAGPLGPERGAKIQGGEHA